MSTFPSFFSESLCTRVSPLCGKESLAEFVELSGEAGPGASVEEETGRLFETFEHELAASGLSLENIVRTRLWGKTREARLLGTAVRSKVLTGQNKASSSSYVAPGHFDSTARVAVDLLAMRPSRPDAERKPVEFEPPRNYLCYLRYDSLAFFSGYTSDAETLELQVPKILTALAGAVAISAAKWDNLLRLSVFLQRSQKIDVVKELLTKGPRVELQNVEFDFVDGFAGEKSLLEIEATALIAGPEPHRR